MLILPLRQLSVFLLDVDFAVLLDTVVLVYMFLLQMNNDLLLLTVCNRN